MSLPSTPVIAPNGLKSVQFRNALQNVLVRLIAESAERSRVFGGEGICEVQYEIAHFLITY